LNGSLYKVLLRKVWLYFKKNIIII
jgi:hypothetical protein